MKIVLCNCPVEKGLEIASALVEERIAACVNIVPAVKSVYHWEGKICQEEESTLLIKIRKADFRRLEDRLQEIHPYSVPEIVALNVADVNSPYMKWLYENTKTVPQE